MRNLLVAITALLLAGAPLAPLAHAQQSVQIVVKSCNTNEGVQNCSYIPVDLTNPLPTISGATSTPLTPITPPGGTLTIASGGTTLTLVSAAGCKNFLYVNNASTAAGQGGIVAAESIWIDPTGAASVTTGGATQAIELAPGTTLPILATTTAVTWVAATTGHKINAFCE